jgi:hypothetical protein
MRIKAHPRNAIHELVKLTVKIPPNKYMSLRTRSSRFSGSKNVLQAIEGLPFHEGPLFQCAGMLL